jgi:hypothetical protein
MILIKNRIHAGFFSNFNAVIGWYWYSIKTGIPVYIHWDGLENQNIFDKFFDQKYQYSPHQYEYDANFQSSPLYTDQIKELFRTDIGESLYNYDNGWFFCQGKVYTDPALSKLRHLYNKVYNHSLKLRTQVIPVCNIPPKTLGVNYRFINHYFTTDGKMTPFKNLMSLEEYNNMYLQQMESTFENGKYEKIYIASSQRIFFEKCLNKFKDKMIFIPLNRLEEDRCEIHRNVPLKKEYTDVLSEVNNLSRCENLLVCPSNITFALLYMNPNINYEIFNFLKETYTG